MKYRAPKGVFDILPHLPSPDEAWRESHRWQYLESVLRQTASDYGYLEIRTPLFESTELFARGIGEGSDIVSKEMYTFNDRADRSITLRPEGTASVIRAFLEHHLDQQGSIHKFFYIGPMFRYERQQAGRYRQHHQFGAEAIGVSSPEQDVELIDMLCESYRRLGLRNLNVCLNSVGDPESREAYRKALEAYLRPHFEALSPDSQARYHKNMLRILDSKDPQDQALLQHCPTLLDYLSSAARDHFEEVQSLLKALQIPYTINTKLVRGLDYYQKTVFEVTAGELGAQNALGGGGRYDGLLRTMDGPDLPSVGYATGLERILQTMLKQAVSFPSASQPILFLIPIGLLACRTAFEITSRLRHHKIATEIDLSQKKVQHGLQRANALGAHYCLVIGDEELARGIGTLKHMASRETFDIPFKDLENYLAKKISIG